MRDYSEPPTDVSTDYHRPVEHLARALQSLLTIGVRERATLSSLLRSVLEFQPGFLAVWAVWEPNALDCRDDAYRHSPGHDATGRFIPCWHRVSGEVRLVPVVGYERPGAGDWYWVPKRRGSSCSVEPMLYPYAGQWAWITSQVAPIIMEGCFEGAVGIDFSAPQPMSSSPKPATTGTLQISLLRNSAQDSLSPREREVLHWLRTGKSNEEIAIILGISPHTVKNHLERVFQKLGVNSRYEAILAQR